jgi:hypothetical protein
MWPKMLVLQSVLVGRRKNIGLDLGTKISQDPQIWTDTHLKSHERIDDRMTWWEFSVQPRAILQSEWRRSLFELDVRSEDGLRFEASFRHLCHPLELFAGLRETEIDPLLIEMMCYVVCGG